MDKIKITIGRLFLLVTLIVVTLITYDKFRNNCTTTIGVPKLMSSYVSPYYEEISENSGLTSINGISNVYINMQADRYSIYKEEITPTTVDVSFVKEGEPAYRYYYDTSTNRITFFSSNYETSGVGVTYIIDRK